MSDDHVPARPANGNPDDPLLAIGAFSRRSRLSLRALRLYDRLGLLKPTEVDRESGYRRYRESQLGIARLVAQLRRLDMSLAQIHEVISSAPEAGAELIARHWATVEPRVASQRELAAHLRSRLTGRQGGFEMYAIHERDVPEQTVLTEQRHVQVPELSNWIGAATERLIKIAAEAGGVAGPMFVIYHGEVNEDSDGPVEVCLPVGTVADGRSKAPIRREPAHREAYVRIKKAQVEFPQILSAYDAVEQWIASKDIAATGAPREVYFEDFMAAGPNDEVCDIAFPI